jgi:hypothetical protein
MALPKFFERVYAAAGGVLSLSRESLERHLGDECVGVELDRAWENTSCVYAADLVVNMAARLYGELNLRGPDSWIESAAALARAINPQVTISNREPTVAIVVGETRRDGDVVYVRSDGWVARVLAQPMQQKLGPPNPLASGMAAGLGMAEMFRRVFRKHIQQARPFEDVSVSLLDFTPDGGASDALASVSLGSLAFAGVGAVANAAIDSLSRLERVQGDIVLVDDQAIDLGNLQRYVLATETDEGAQKVDIASHAFARTGATVAPRCVTLEAYAETTTLPPIIAVSVDNIPTRRAVQALLPRVAINGWTSRAGLGASWHELGEAGPCLACDYQPEGQLPSQFDLVMQGLGLSRDRVAKLWVFGEPITDEDLDAAATHLKVERAKLAVWLGKDVQDLFTSVVCGQVPLDLSGGKGPLEAVPLAHQSVMAGIMMASEIVKRADNSLRSRSQSAAMVRWDNVLQATPKRWTVTRAPAHNCICRDEAYRRRYRSKWSLD